MKQAGKAAAAVALAVLLGAMSTPRAVQELKVTNFGLYSDLIAEGGEIEGLQPYAVIPYHVGTSCYGWELGFEPVTGTVELDEVLKLPGPGQWNGDANSVVDADEDSARTHLQFDGQYGFASHSWCVAEGDPEGQYVFTLFFKGKQIGQLPFRVRRR